MRRAIKNSILALLVLMTLGSCQEEVVPDALDPAELVAGRLAGTWGKPTKIITPENVPAEVFGAMRLVFTADGENKPSQFLAKDCPIVFSGTEATWQVTGTEHEAIVSLTGVTPVDEFRASVSSTTLTLNFHMGWENTDTGDTGRGDFSVTLSRQ